MIAICPIRSNLNGNEDQAMGSSSCDTLSAPIEPVGEVLLPEQQSYHRVLHPARGETVQETRVVLLRSRHTAEAMAAGQVEATASGQGPAESINWAVVLYGGRPPSEHNDDQDC